MLVWEQKNGLFERNLIHAWRFSISSVCYQTYQHDTLIVFGLNIFYSWQNMTKDWAEQKSSLYFICLWPYVTTLWLVRLGTSRKNFCMKFTFLFTSLYGFSLSWIKLQLWNEVKMYLTQDLSSLYYYMYVDKVPALNSIGWVTWANWAAVKK